VSGPCFVAPRDAHAKQFNYDLDAICEDLRKREKTSGQPTVSLPPPSGSQRRRPCKTGQGRHFGPTRTHPPPRFYTVPLAQSSK